MNSLSFPTMVYAAEWVLPLASPPLRDGWVAVEGNRVVGIGHGSPPENHPLKRLTGCLLMPGLINLHAHLELSGLRNRLPRQASFAGWVRSLRLALADWVKSDYRESTRLGMLEALQTGTTTLLDVGNTGEALHALADSPLRAYAFLETLSQDPTRAEAVLSRAEALLAEAASGIPESQRGRIRLGLSLHAPYSCSPELHRAVAARQAEAGLPFTEHMAESREELRHFAEGAGPVWELCRETFPTLRFRGPQTPWSAAGFGKQPPKKALWVHGNVLDVEAMEAIAASNGTVVHCPGSHEFFSHPEFPFEALRDRGIPVCLGTDSLASGESLNLFDEMRRFRLKRPDVAAEEILAMVTRNPARALGREAELGGLAPGAFADLLALRLDGGATEAPYEAALQALPEVELVVIDGETVLESGET